MSLKREMLIDAGIEDKAVLDNIMQAYGAGIENAKTQAKSEVRLIIFGIFPLSLTLFLEKMRSFQRLGTMKILKCLTF